MKHKSIYLAVFATFYPFNMKGDDRARVLAAVGYLLDQRSKRYLYK